MMTSLPKKYVFLRHTNHSCHQSHGLTCSSRAAMNNQDTHPPHPPPRPSKLHKRSSSSPDAPNKSLQTPPPPPHRRRLIKRNSGSSHHQNQQQHHQKMDPGPLTMPPAPTSSDLSVDKELLQRWSARESPNGKSYPQSFETFVACCAGLPRSCSDNFDVSFRVIFRCV
jgi:hypothetical protein